MTLSSTIPAAIDWLASAFRECEDLAGVEVRTAGVPADQIGRDQITILGTVDNDTEWAFASKRVIDESYSLGGVIHCIRPGKGEEAAKNARDQAFSVWDAVVAIIIDDPTLGETVRVARPALTDFDQEISHKGDRLAQLLFAVRVESRLVES